MLGVCLSTSIHAQEKGAYNILSVDGHIIDQKTNKELQIGEKINLQTMLEFENLQDKAILLSPSKVKYRLEVPKTHTSNQVVSSQRALQQVKSRPMLVTGVRGVEAQMISDGVSTQSLGEYFGQDTFTIIGNQLKLPVSSGDMEKYKLVIRYENDGVKEVVLEDFLISRDDLDLNTAQPRISECFLLLNDDHTMSPVTQVSLFFVDENRLFEEFSALLQALRVPKKDTPKSRKILKQYCLDIYGTIDQKNLNQSLRNYFD
jgi:hypothetical protein